MTSNQRIARFPVLLSAGGLALAVSLLAACSRDSGVPVADSASAVCTKPAPFPAGFGYPQSAPTIEKWVADTNTRAAREHGWRLWAGLQTDAGGKWVWRSWCTETQAFAASGGTGTKALGDAQKAATTPHGELPMRVFKLQNGPSNGQEPINFPVAPSYPVPGPVAQKYVNSQCINKPKPDPSTWSLANGAQFQNNGDVMVAGVIYNDAAYNWIRQKQLYEASTLQGMVPAANQNAQMPPMPSGSISLKPMLWPVKKSGYTALPVWDDLQSDNDQYSGFEIQSQWPRAVAVTPQTASEIATVDVTYLHGVQMNGQPLGPNTYRQARTVGIDKFYSFQPDLKSLDTCDQAILDASAYYAYGRMFEQGDYLALIAMHIITKEQPDWTFQSVWWSDRPNTGPYAANRPVIPGAKGPWQNYLMTSTYGWEDPTNPGNWPIAYNPYIELAADHPIATNCMNCHHRAAWPENGKGYLAPGGPGALQVFNYMDEAVFNGLIGVDSLWSIADRVPSPSQKKDEDAAKPK